ncbi:DUF3857 domain-containing protein [Flavobacterium selenitireducens]|uniref:DUF3857 domain-containing protein n=1 Tax=Flavobacterium selenitireducens TaxID=2722704 RepID=UPI00168AED11|nr:DUF3857 domain-containing protein [Flavobacterium selenitireducens]MBD3583210.1 DUF3857 and transglutaminase domain-containing protein [Flavobacterium selenitireducens]
MNKILHLVTLLLIATPAFSQKFEIQKVTVADLEQKALPADPSAQAAILFSIGEVNFRYDKEKGFRIYTTVKTRIKIYGSAGYEWGNFEKNYYDAASANRERLTFGDACTYNLVNGQIEKTKLRSDGIFDSKLNKYWGQKKIAMPNVREGSIIEFEYTLESPNIGTLPQWNFQDAIPVVYSEFRTIIPEYLVYSHYQKGFYTLEVETKIGRNSISYRQKHEAEGVMIKAYVEEVDVKFSETTTIYRAKNLPSIKEEKFLSSYRNYICGISHELMMTKFPGSTIKSYSSDWGDVAKNILEDDDFGGQLSKSGYFEEQIKTLTAGMSKPQDKLSAIFQFVKTNVKWNGFRNYWCDQGVKTAFREHSGNSAEINLMLTAMLRYSGLDANPVLVSTRSHGISLFPAVSAFDYVVSSVRIDGAIVLLDATEAFAMPNVLPMRALNWKGLLVDREGKPQDVNLWPASPASENRTLAYTLSADGKIEGKVRRQLSGNIALDFRNSNTARSNEHYLETLENQSGQIEIVDYKRENESDYYKDVIETYSFSKSQAADIVGDKLYFSPLLFLAATENPFKLETRDYPVDFGFAVKSKHIVLIELPEGYAVESIPAGVSMITDGNFGSFKYTIAQTGSKLQLVVNSEIAQPLVPSEAYPVIRDFYQKMVDKQNEKIVLKKI